jgi:hypothetical protein
MNFQNTERSPDATPPEHIDADSAATKSAPSPGVKTVIVPFDPMLGPEWIHGQGRPPWKTWGEQTVLPGTDKRGNFLYPKCSNCAHHGCEDCEEYETRDRSPRKDTIWHCCRCRTEMRISDTAWHMIIFVPRNDKWGHDAVKNDEPFRIEVLPRPPRDESKAYLIPLRPTYE